MQQGAQSQPPLGRKDNSRLLSKMVCSCRGGEASCALSCLLSSFLSICIGLRFSQASLVAQTVKNLPAMQETWVQSLGREDPLEKEMATHSRILAWEIP